MKMCKTHLSRSLRGFFVLALLALFKPFNECIFQRVEPSLYNNAYHQTATDRPWYTPPHHRWTVLDEPDAEQCELNAYTRQRKCCTTRKDACISYVKQSKIALRINTYRNTRVTNSEHHHHWWHRFLSRVQSINGYTASSTLIKGL